jgi:hypothetical protein
VPPLRKPGRAGLDPARCSLSEQRARAVVRCNAPLSHLHGRCGPRTVSGGGGAPYFSAWSVGAQLLHLVAAPMGWRNISAAKTLGAKSCGVSMFRMGQAHAPGHPGPLALHLLEILVADGGVRDC